jgi:hypothetical protein
MEGFILGLLFIDASEADWFQKRRDLLGQPMMGLPNWYNATNAVVKGASMTVLQVTSQTDADGSLRLEVGVPNATVRATLVVEGSVPPKPDDERKREWEQFVRRTAGSIADPNFRRHPQGDFPKREWKQ